VKYILKIKRFPINDREEVIRISYVDEHDELCECIYVLEKKQYREDVFLLMI